MTETFRTVSPADIQLRGDIDHVGLLTEELCNAIERASGPISIDLAAVTFLDASGLAMLSAVHEYAHTLGRTIRWHGVHGMPARVLSITGLDHRPNVGPS